MELLKLLQNHVQVRYEFYYSKDIGMGPRLIPFLRAIFLCFLGDVTAKKAAAPLF